MKIRLTFLQYCSHQYGMGLNDYLAYGLSMLEAMGLSLNLSEFLQEIIPRKNLGRLRIKPESAGMHEHYLCAMPIPQNSINLKFDDAVVSCVLPKIVDEHI